MDQGHCWSNASANLQVLFGNLSLLDVPCTLSQKVWRLCVQLRAPYSPYTFSALTVEPLAKPSWKKWPSPNFAIVWQGWYSFLWPIISSSDSLSCIIVRRSSRLVLSSACPLIQNLVHLVPCPLVSSATRVISSPLTIHLVLVHSVRLDARSFQCMSFPVVVLSLHPACSSPRLASSSRKPVHLVRPLASRLTLVLFLPRPHLTLHLVSSPSRSIPSSRPVSSLVPSPSPSSCQLSIKEQPFKRIWHSRHISRYVLSLIVVSSRVVSSSLVVSCCVVVPRRVVLCCRVPRVVLCCPSSFHVVARWWEFEWRQGDKDEGLLPVAPKSYDPIGLFIWFRHHWWQMWQTTMTPDRLEKSR